MIAHVDSPRCVLSLLLLLACVAAGAVLCASCGKAPEPAAKQPAEPKEAAKPAEPPPPPPPKPIRLAKLEPVKLDPGGKASVELKVDREGNQGAIRVEVAGAPEGIIAATSEIAEGESAGHLELAAAEKLGDEELKATLRVSVALGDLKAEQPLEVTVPKVNLPALLPVSELILLPGVAKSVDLAVQRNGYEGSLDLRVESPPEKIAVKVQPLAAGQNGTKVEITAAGDAPEEGKTIQLGAKLYGRTVSVQIPVRVDRRPYQVKSFMVVTLKPGESKRVEIPVERRSYKGPLQIEVTGLPEGVTVPKAELAQDQTTLALNFTAAPDAKERVCSAKVISKGGPLERSDPLVVRVSRGDNQYLPEEIAVDPEASALFRRGSFGGRRTPQSKQILLDAYGGTKESEDAVLRGLRWLAAHQQADGHWSLNEYGKGVPQCDCQSEFEQKVVDSDTAGTAFGVLPFLGAGVTHTGGPATPPELVQYRKRVFSALVYLAQHQEKGKDPKDKNAGRLDGNMYAHALGTMALCEGYGLSGDERLRVPAQMAVKYLAESQHATGGGWRYGPGQPGDMSVTAWVFLAIRSAQLSGLPIGQGSLTRAERFVNSCAVGPEGARLSRYSYQPPTPENPNPEKLSLTAAGLLTRQYLGWKQDNADLLAGCKYLMGNLPPESASTLGDVYYYHYATQVLHHMGGPDFDLWNHRMREHLIRTQEKGGHKDGSWNPQGTTWGDRGGRMYATAMALLTLEVYYRHLPMYRYVKRGGETQ